MATFEAHDQQHNDLTDSGMTIPSDSESYSNQPEPLYSSPPVSSSSSPMILYSPPTVWGLLRGAAINLLLPFVNGLMLGFGELFAHEAAFRFGWSGTKVRTASQKSSNTIVVASGLCINVGSLEICDITIMIMMYESDTNKLTFSDFPWSSQRKINRAWH